MTIRALAWLAVGLLVGACDPDSEDGGSGDTDGHDHDESEQITRVTLAFSPEGGGDPVTASFSDPDGDGGMSGSSEPITLAAATSYTLEITIANELEDPAEDLTPEVRDEAEEHLVLLYGDAVAGPATNAMNGLLGHAYADLESDYGDEAVGEDLPVGLRNTITTDATGTGVLRVMLRHLPEINGEPVKTAALPGQLAADESLPGEPDVDVAFDVTVQ